MQKHLAVAVAGALALLLAPRVVRADDAAPPGEGVNKEEKTPEKTKDAAPLEVNVTGSRADSLQRVPGSGTVLGKKDLERAAPVDTAEMLRRVPGVQVRQDYGGGNRIDISIRGLDGGRSRRVLVLEDGMPMSINPYSEPDMYFGPAIERYRAIEVVKGSGNILFGPQTLAGTINFLTIAPPERPTATVDVDVGTYGYARTLGRWGDRVGETRYVVQLLHRRGDGFRNLPFDSTNGLAKVSFPTGTDGEAVVKLGFHRDDAGSDDVGMTSAMYAAEPRRKSLSPLSRSVLNRYDAALTHEQRFSSATKLKTLVYGYVLDRVWRRQDYTRSPVPGETYASVFGDPSVPGGAIFFRNANTVLDRTYDVIGLEPRFEHRMDTLGVGHTIDFGGRVLRESAHYMQRSGGYAETYAGSFDFEERHTGTAFAAYVQDRMAFGDKLLVTPGIRFEYLAFRRTITRREGADVYEEGDKTVHGIVPGIGMVYGTKRINVFGGLHVGFAPPRVTSAINNRGVTTDVSADRSINYELGSRTNLVRGLRLEATGFLSNFSNQVIVATGPTASEAVLTDAGATNLYGLESASVLALNKIFEFPTTVELGARYTYAHSTFRYGPNAGKFLPYAPQHSFNTNFDVEHASGLGGQIAYTFIGEQFADAANTREESVTGLVGVLGPRHIVDATLHYKHRPSGLTFRLTAKNLLDVDYIIARRPEGIFPGPFRQILVGVRWDWEGAPRD